MNRKIFFLGLALIVDTAIHAAAAAPPPYAPPPLDSGHVAPSFSPVTRIVGGVIGTAIGAEIGDTMFGAVFGSLPAGVVCGAWGGEMVCRRIAGSGPFSLQALSDLTGESMVSVLVGLTLWITYKVYTARQKTKEQNRG